MNYQPRCVWLTGNGRDWLVEMAERCPSGFDRGGIESLIRQWDAAPADATEAVLEAIDQGHIDDTSEARDVLRALGYPS